MEEFNKTIYKKDSKDKIRSLQIYTDNGKLIQISGLLDGKKVEHSSLSKPKNVGKANETTSKEQAILEAESKINKKLDEGYFETIKEAETKIVILPMLAKDYKKEYKKVVFPCYAQPKLDGMRALCEDNSFISRKGKVIDTVSHIKVKSGYVVDGELYSHGNSFQENMRLLKKYRKNETEKVKFHIYDLVVNVPFKERLKLLETLRKNNINNNNIIIVKTVVVNNEKELIEFHKQNITEGYEGTMVRWGEDGYKINGRSSNLLKYKDFIDRVYEVVDVIPSDKNPEQGVIHCKGLNSNNEEITFGCGMKFSHKEREEFLLNKINYIGKMAEIRFFEFSEDGIPRFPVCYGIRLDK